MANLNRVFQISDGLAKIAGNKIKSAVSELQKEKVVTQAEAKQILAQMSKAKKNIYEAAVRELKKVLSKASATSKKKKN